MEKLLQPDDGWTCDETCRQTRRGHVWLQWKTWNCANISLTDRLQSWLHVWSEGKLLQQRATPRASPVFLESQTDWLLWKRAYVRKPDSDGWIIVSFHVWRWEVTLKLLISLRFSWGFEGLDFLHFRDLEARESFSQRHGRFHQSSLRRHWSWNQLLLWNWNTDVGLQTLCLHTKITLSSVQLCWNKTEHK